MRVGTPPLPAIDVEVPGEIEQLILSTPTNPEYSGETFGVKFHEGSAIVSRYKKHKFGYSINRLAWLFLHDAPGVYEVKIVYASDSRQVSDPMRIQAAPDSEQIAIKPAPEGVSAKGKR